LSVVRILNNRRYEICFGSDVLRDGVFLELSDRSGDVIEVLAEAFFYDEEGRVVFSCFKEQVPYVLIKWLHETVAAEGWPIE